MIVPSTTTTTGTATATVTVNSGGQTIVTFIDVAPLPAANTGFLQVCKIGGPGVSGSFSFTVAGNAIPLLAAGAAPGGTCSTPLQVTAGSVVVTEAQPGPGNAVLTGVSTLPSGLLVSSNLGTGTATVTVNAGGQTIVTFTNVVPVALTTGFLAICKVAQNGVLAGVDFTFNVNGSSVSVAAGAGPLGNCSPALAMPAGPITITESLPANIVLNSVATLPNAGLLVGSNLGAGTATVTVPMGGTTVATFTDGVMHDVFQVSYASNLNQGDSFVNLTNTGFAGNICVNVFAFDSAEELISCCSCVVTPNGLVSLSAQHDLLNNTLTPAVPGSVVIKLLVSAQTGAASCNAATPTPTTLEPGLLAWGTSLHQNTNTSAFQVTENAFQQASLSRAELEHITAFCSFIQSTGSGFGICGSCQSGGK